MIDTDGVITLDHIQIVLLIQHRKTERALQLLSHVLQDLGVEGFLLFDQLYSNIAVGFDFGMGKLPLMTQFDTTRLDARWYYYSRWPVTPPAPKPPSSLVSEYINELKRMAERLGFSGREVDALLSDGFTADEVADFLYEGAF